MGKESQKNIDRIKSRFPKSLAKKKNLKKVEIKSS